MPVKEIYQKLKDGVNTANTLLQIVDKNAMPDPAKKAEEERKRKEKEEQNRKVFMYVSIGSGVVLLGLILLLYFKNKAKNE